MDDAEMIAEKAAEREGIILEFFNKINRISGGLLVKALATNAYRRGRFGVLQKGEYDNVVRVADVATLLAAGAGSFISLEMNPGIDMLDVSRQVVDAIRSSGFRAAPERVTQDAIKAAVTAFVEALPKHAKEN